jgi:hypothetical protein
MGRNFWLEMNRIFWMINEPKVSVKHEPNISTEPELKTAVLRKALISAALLTLLIKIW